MLTCNNYLSCTGNPCGELVNESGVRVARISYNKIDKIRYDLLSSDELQQIKDSGLEIDES